MIDIFDAYKILGCHAGSTNEEIKGAHRRLSQESHPDRKGDQDAFMRVQVAYRQVRGPEARKLHSTRLSTLGTECQRCGGKGYLRKTKKFTASVLTGCAHCDGNGFLPRHPEDEFGA